MSDTANLRTHAWIRLYLMLGLALLLAGCAGRRGTAAMEWVRVSADQRGFEFQTSGRPFVPLGFNYDHDEPGRLLEDYWDAEWATVATDLQEARDLGANVVRIHLQFGRFMRSPVEPDPHALQQLRRLVDAAEQLRLYLDLTGLGCYHKADVPPWYDRLDEAARWAAQARFWEAIAQACHRSPAVFCYDLMNEPVVPGGKRQPGDWLGPPFGGKCFVQCITLDQAGRVRHEVAREWIRRLVGAIRKHDQRHLVTVGLVPWSLDQPGLSSGFVPDKIASELDFISVHLYPERSKVDESLRTLRGFAVGKPVVIEETFPLSCSLEELDDFIARSRGIACGWIGFYWGKTPAEYRPPKDMRDALMLGWLEWFQRRAAQTPRQPTNSATAKP